MWYEGNQKIDELISKHLFDVRWREVFILLAGVVDKADDLLKPMLKAAEKRLADEPRAVQLLRWANSSAVPVEDAGRMAARRAFALTLKLVFDLTHAFAHALNLDVNDARYNALVVTLDYARVRARDLALDFDFDRALLSTLDRTLDCAVDLERARLNAPSAHTLDFMQIWKYVDGISSLTFKIGSSKLLLGAWHEAYQRVEVIREQPNKDFSIEEIFRSWNQTLDLLANAMQLPPELCAPEKGGEQSYAFLHAYLYACQLIVDCKKAATRVSRSTWNDICQRMLNPPERSSSGGGAHKSGQQKARLPPKVSDDS